MQTIDKGFQIKSNRPSVEYARWLQYRIDRIEEDVKKKGIKGDLKQCADNLIHDFQNIIKEVSGFHYQCYDMYYLGKIENVKECCSPKTFDVIEYTFLNPDSRMSDIYMHFAEEYHVKNFNGLSLSETELVMDIGELKEIAFHFIPDGYFVKDMEFESSDFRIAIVNTKGIVRAVSEGQTTIIVKTKDGIYKTEFMVCVLPEKLKM